MNSIIERNVSIRARLNELCIRISDFRQKLVGSLPMTNGMKENIAVTVNSKIFLDCAHSVASDLEERITELEANLNQLETFFPEQPSAPSMSGFTEVK